MAQKYMNPFKVKMIVCENGERLPLLLSSMNGLPVRHPNQWIIFSRRINNQTATLERELRTIGYLYWWAKETEINLDECLETGVGLTAEEINPSLYEWMRRDFTNGKSVKKIAVASSTLRSRLETVREYIVWRLENTLSHINVDDQRFDKVKIKIELIKKQFIKDLPCQKINRRIGLEAQLRDRFLQIIHPNHPNNPWNKPVKFRNYLLCLMYLGFGLRRAEALKLYLSDINLNADRPSITVRRRPDDKNDIRMHEPRVKTLGRIIPLNQEMARLLNEFILKHRSKISNAKKSPFLFLASRDGKPLSSIAINNMIWQLIKKHNEFSGVLSPHILRHSYNDFLSEIADKEGIAEHDAIEIRNYLCGWSHNSEQGNNYRQRYIKQRSFDLSLKHQQLIFSNNG
ncbi:MAG: phage integrase family protein [Gammaproteobacteria bacterium]|jgi:integrase|nr:phage integrase family protein [Gammaproteobacteria bacterium]